MTRWSQPPGSGAPGVDLTVQQLAQASALARALHACVNVPPLQPSGLVPDYALSSQLPAERGGSGVQVSFLRPDGMPLDRAPNQPELHLTVLVPDGTIPQTAMAVAGPAPCPKDKARLSGWEDRAFEFLTIA